MPQSAPAVLTCPACGAAAVVLQERPSVCAAGILGGLLFVIGGLGLLGSMLAAAPSGAALLSAVVIGLGVLIGAVGRPKRTVLKCPACGDRRRLD